MRKLATGILGAFLVVASMSSVTNAETVVEKAARTGTITMGGRTDIIPYSYINDKKELVGYSLDIGSLIEEEVTRYLGKPVKVVYEPVDDSSKLISSVMKGDIDIACNMQFTWEREMYADFSMPYSLSGIRLLAPKGRFSGNPKELSGKRIGVIPNSLSESTIKLVQPNATLISLKDIDEAISELIAGRVDAVAGDTVILAGNIQRFNTTKYDIIPTASYARYAVACMMPQNNSTFRNLTNLAIGQMLQGYVSGDVRYTKIVDKWMGPNGIIGLPSMLIKDFFQMVLLTYEQLPLSSSSTSVN